MYKRYCLLFIFKEKTAVVGKTPEVFIENANIHVEEGNIIRAGEYKAINITCSAYISVSSAIVKLDWFLITENGMMDATSVPDHKVSCCKFTG